MMKKTKYQVRGNVSFFELSSERGSKVEVSRAVRTGEHTGLLPEKHNKACRVRPFRMSNVATPRSSIYANHVERCNNYLGLINLDLILYSNFCFIVYVILLIH